jgi:hypothetical protein
MTSRVPRVEPTTKPDADEPGSTPSPDGPRRNASERLTRVLYLAVGTSAVVFGALSLESFLAQTQTSVALAWWLLAFGLPTTLGVLSHIAPLSVLRVIAVAEGIVFLAILAYWLVYRVEPLPAGADIPWSITFTGIPTVAVAVIAPPAVAWAYTGLVCLLSGFVRMAASADPQPALVGLEDGLYSLLLMSVFVGLTMAAKRSASRISLVARVEREALRNQAARLARKQERLTVDALVHDSVLSALLMAGGGRVAAGDVARQAQKALEQLDAMGEGKAPPTLSAAEVEAAVRLACAEIAPDATFRAEPAVAFAVATGPLPANAPGTGTGTGTTTAAETVGRTPGECSIADEIRIPTGAAAALLGAASEALRNSVASAARGNGPDDGPEDGPEKIAELRAGDAVENRADNTSPDRAVSRTVTFRVVGAGVEMIVADDGVGFDVADVPAERLGVSQSIVGRMRRTPGGSADVGSAPGEGTVVALSWQPPRSSRAQTAPSGTAGVAPANAVAAAIGTPAIIRRNPLDDRHWIGSRVPAGAGTAHDKGDAHSEAEQILVAAIRPSSSSSVGSTGADRAALPLTGMLGISTPIARGIVVLFIVVHAVLAFADPDPRADVLLEAAAFLSISAAAIWVTRAAPDPLPRVRTLGILGLLAATSMVASTQVAPAGAPPFAHWHAGAVTLLLLILAVRGRPGWAWVGCGGLCVITVDWAVMNGLPVAAGIDLVIRHAGMLLGGTLFAVGLRRSIQTLNTLNRELGTREAAEATEVAAINERQAQLARVDDLARPTLEMLARATQLSREDRDQCLLVEASLRDAIRGRALFVEPVITAARNARARGVDVTLLDDGGEHSLSRIERVVEVVTGELDAASSGRIIARVLPAGRTTVATVVVEGTEHRMLSITPSGEVLGR